MFTSKNADLAFLLFAILDRVAGAIEAVVQDLDDDYVERFRARSMLVHDTLGREQVRRLGAHVAKARRRRRR